MSMDLPDPPDAPASPDGSGVVGTRVRPGVLADAEPVIAIREAAIRASTALWIDTVPPHEESLAWFTAHAERGSVLVAELREPGTGDWSIVGFATHAPLRPYEGYRWTAEDSVYLASRAQGRGLGRALLEALTDTAASAGMHSLVGMIEASNAASIVLHERCGFAEVGRIPQAGRKFDRWLDLVIMQRLL